MTKIYQQQLPPICRYVLQLTLAGLCALPFMCTAQGYLEPAKLSYDIMPLQAQNSSADKNFYAHNLQLNDAAPIFLKKDTSQYLIAGIDFQYLNFTGTHPDFPVTSVYSIAPLLGYYLRVSRHTYLCAILFPLVNSDFSSLQGSDVHMGGVVGASYRFSDKLIVRLKAGVAVQYYGPQYVALLGFDWKITGKWRAWGEFPIYSNLAYSISRKVNAGVNYSGISTSYNLPQQDHYFEYTATQLGVFAEYYLTRMLALRATAGYSLERHMEVYSDSYKPGGGAMYVDDGPHTTALNPQIDNGLVYRLSLCLRVPEGR